MADVTGYDEALEWLTAHVSEWRLQRADTTLRASAFVGGPTERQVEVVLVPASTEWPREPDVFLSGQGRTIIEAVQAAVGVLAALDNTG